MSRYQTTGELLDVLECGTDALIFIGDLLVRGSVVSVDILWLCQEPRTFVELKAHCLDAFGEPTKRGLDEAVRASIRELMHAGVLAEVQ